FAPCSHARNPRAMAPSPAALGGRRPPALYHDTLRRLSSRRSNKSTPRAPRNLAASRAQLSRFRRAPEKIFSHLRTLPRCGPRLLSLSRARALRVGHHHPRRTTGPQWLACAAFFFDAESRAFPRRTGGNRSTAQAD